MSAPSSTYRLQITRDFTLHDAAALVPYLHQLGVGAVYVSPLLRSAAGSTHGYDVVDHDLVDPDRGGEAGLKALAEAATHAGLGLVVDIVPNHMGVADAAQNRAWWDVLENGQASTYASWFDIVWAYGAGRVLIPVLGDDFDAEKDLTLVGGELHYYEHRYPIAAGTADAGTPSQVHDRQAYELISFRRADTDQNYRRFFAVTELAGLRVESEEVFDATHTEILRWRADYGVTGIRIDHPDGLVDPAQYLRRLADRAPEAWITVEKITEPGESMPAEWPVAGMTGYDALAEVNDVLVDPAGEPAFTKLYTEITGDTLDWPGHVAAGKRMVVSTILQAEVRRLARLVHEDALASALVIAALSELVVWFPVYRSYLPRGADQLERAVDQARSARPGRCHRYPAAATERPGRRTQSAVPTVDRRRHGQGSGRHRLLPLQPFDRVERSRRVPRHLWIQPGRLPCRPADSRRPLARGNDDVIDPRHEARRGYSRPHRRPPRNHR
jgi:(1->4)-alpha-D-glucan 1-alpha-D-glucosylmutase